MAIDYPLRHIFSSPDICNTLADKTIVVKYFTVAIAIFIIKKIRPPRIFSLQDLLRKAQYKMK